MCLRTVPGPRTAVRCLGTSQSQTFPGALASRTEVRHSPGVHPSSLRLVLLLLVGILWIPSRAAILDDTALRAWVERFNRNDDELYRQEFPTTAPSSSCGGKSRTSKPRTRRSCRTYYFRWWTFRKHLRKTADGFVVTEFLPAVPWAGKHNAISCPLGHHLAEGRWLHSRVYLDDTLRFWLTRTTGTHLRTYSSWVATGVWRRRPWWTPNPALLSELFRPLIRNYEGWEREHRRPDGLFVQNDGNDGMEVAIGGSGKRPTLNGCTSTATPSPWPPSPAPSAIGQKNGGSPPTPPASAASSRRSSGTRKPPFPGPPRE